MEKPHGINPVYNVTNLDKSIHFYRDILGLIPVTIETSGFAAFRSAVGFQIILNECGEPAGTSSTPPIVFLVKRIKQIYKLLKRRGVRFTAPPPSRENPA